MYLGMLNLLLLLLFLWLFPSSVVAAMVVDRLFPVSPVSFSALSQSYSLHVPLAHILPPCLWSPSLPFPRYRFRHHSPHYVIFFHPHDVPIPFQSSLRYLSGRLHYFRRSSYVFVPDFVFSCHSIHPPHILVCSMTLKMTDNAAVIVTLNMAAIVLLFMCP